MRSRRSSASSSTYLRRRPTRTLRCFPGFILESCGNSLTKKNLSRWDREAAATAICAVVIMAAFWAALLLLKDSPETLFEMPLWFSVSCLGGYVLSVVAVIFLVKRYFRDFDLDQDAPEESETTKGDAA